MMIKRSITGGTTFVGRMGLYKCKYYVDYNSLYPSIMI